MFGVAIEKYELCNLYFDQTFKHLYLLTSQIVWHNFPLFKLPNLLFLPLLLLLFLLLILHSTILLLLLILLLPYSSSPSPLSYNQSQTSYVLKSGDPSGQYITTIPGIIDTAATYACLDLACFLSKEIFHCHLFTILFWLYLSGTDPGLWTHSVNNSRKHLNWFCKMFQNFTSLFILKSRYRKKYMHAILCI